MSLSGFENHQIVDGFECLEFSALEAKDIGDDVKALLSEIN